MTQEQAEQEEQKHKSMELQYMVGVEAGTRAPQVWLAKVVCIAPLLAKDGYQATGVFVWIERDFNNLRTVTITRPPITAEERAGQERSRQALIAAFERAQKEELHKREEDPQTRSASTDIRADRERELQDRVREYEKTLPQVPLQGSVLHVRQFPSHRIDDPLWEVPHALQLMQTVLSEWAPNYILRDVRTYLHTSRPERERDIEVQDWAYLHEDNATQCITVIVLRQPEGCASSRTMPEIASAVWLLSLQRLEAAVDSEFVEENTLVIVTGGERKHGALRCTRIHEEHSFVEAQGDYIPYDASAAFALANVVSAAWPGDRLVSTRRDTRPAPSGALTF